MKEQWQELKETIIEMRDNDGTCTQQEACKFLADYMEVLEKQMQEPCEDEYIKVPKRALKYRTAGMVAYNAEWLKKNWQTELKVMGIECEDAISRHGVIDAMIKRFDGENAHDEFWNCDMVMGVLRDMQPVTPQPKTGKWIRFKEFENGYYHIKCSECGQYWSIDGHAKIFKHCFNCGTKMAESEEE